jgi:AraC family L-rhamnose operon transcriptional activator RhaR
MDADPSLFDQLLEPRRLFYEQQFADAHGPVQVSRPRHQGDIGLHDHDFEEIAVVVGGRARQRSLHGVREIARGDVLVLHPGQWHGYEACVDLDLWNCCFRTRLLAHELAWTRTDPLLAPLLPTALEADGDGGTPRGRRHTASQGVLALRLDAADLAGLERDLDTLATVQARPDHAPSEVIASLLAILCRIGRHPDLAARAHGPADALIARATAALDARLDHEWSLDELETLLGLSRSYLVRRFRRHTGMAPMAWLAQRRAEKAAVLLVTTDLPVAEIGRQVGWNDANYFARRFRACFGMTASAYRSHLPVPPLVR